MNDKILLTVGIPTYNGATYLSQAIASILREIPDGDENVVEILISDNASTDSTSQVVRPFLVDHPDLITYVRNTENVGYDKNVDLLMQRAKGDYVKLLGDDDELLKGSLERLLKEIRSNPRLKVIVHSVQFVDAQTGQKIDSSHKIYKTKSYGNGDEFFQASQWATAALSALVIKKSEWLNCELGRYVGTQWMHLGGIIEVLRFEGFSLGIEDKLVSVRLNNSRWAGNFGSQLKAGIDHLNVMRNLLTGGYSRNTFDVFLIDRYRHNLGDILQLRSNSFSLNFSILLPMLRNFWYFPTFWMTHIPALLIGEKFVSAGRYFKKCLIGVFRG